MAINTQKFLPSSKGGSLAKMNKTLIKSSSSVSLSDNSVKNIGIIKVKVIEIDSILKGTLASEKKKLSEAKKQDSSKRREKIEEKLETKPKAESGKIKMPSLPRMGFLDWVKNFIGNVILGYFAVRLVDHLPKIIPIVKFLGKATDFVLGVGGKLLDGLVTFIDWGYKAYDATRGFVKNLFGEGGVKQFDQLSSLLNQFLNLAIIAGMAAAGSGGRGLGGTGGGASARPGPGQGGRPKVTTSGGGRAGGIDIRNPLRQRPKVTMGRGGNRALLSSVRPFLKRIPLPVVGALVDFGLSWALGENPGRAAFRAIGAAILGTIGGGLAGALGLAGGPLAVATGALGAIAGGTLGDMAGGALYDLFFGGKKPSGKSGKYASGGITRGGRPQRGVKRTVSKKGRYRRRLAPQKPGDVEPNSPGADVGGEEKLFGLFPNPLKAFQRAVDVMNPFKVIQRAGQNLGDSDYFGPILAITSKILLGQKPTQQDYKNVGLGINMLVAKGIDDGKLKGGLAAFAEGGFVDPKTLDAISQGGDISDWVAKSFKDSTETNAQKTLREIQENLRLKTGGGGPGTEQPSDQNIPTGTGALTGNTNAEKVFNYLIGYGFTPQAAAGVIGNLMQESGVNPKSRQLGGGPGRGIMQWGTGPGSGGRWDALVAWASSSGKDPWALDTQVQWMMREMKSYGTLNRLKGVTDIKKAVQIFEREMEKAGVPNYPRRYQFAADALASFGGGKAGLGYMDGKQGPLSGGVKGGSLRTGPSQYIGGSTAYHIDTKFHKSLGMGNMVSAMDKLANAYSSRGRKIEFSNAGVSGEVWNTKASSAEKQSLLQRAIDAHSHSRFMRAEGFLPFDYYNPKKNDNRFGKSVEGSEILLPTFGGKVDVGTKYGGYGKSAEIYSGNKMVAMTGHGDIRYEKGGLTLGGPHMAMLGEKGKEFVIDADSTAAIEQTFPGFLGAINTAKYEQAINVLRNFASYESGSEQTVVIVDMPMDATSQGYDEPVSSGSVYVGGGEEESDPFSTLYQGG